MVLKIITIPDERLRQVSAPVDLDDLNDDDFQQFLDDMVETMDTKDGIGLAAPQTGYNIRVITVSSKNGPLIMINPEITKKSITKEWDEEGCLSVPHTFGQVKRYRQIHCRFTNRRGEVKKIAAQGLLARVIQHEIDHLNGVLFTDKAKKITTEKYTL